VAELDIATVFGDVRSQIFLETNDPRNREFVLTLKAKVIGGVMVLPTEALYMRNRVGRPPLARHLLRKVPGEDGDLAIGDVELSADWLQVSLLELEDAREAGGGLPEAFPGDWIVEVAVRSLPVYGRSEEFLRMTTGLTREPEVLIPIVLELKTPVNLSTERVSLSPGRSSETIFFSLREGADPATLRVDSEHEGLVLELEPAGGRFFKFRVTGAPTHEGAEAAVRFRLGRETLQQPVEWHGSP
jgi:hypothetical protein